MKSKTFNMVEFVGINDVYPCHSKAFKQLQVQEIVEIPHQKPDIEQITRVTVEGKALTTKIVNIPKAISYEGQRLTGYKLIIEGQLVQKIEYIAANDKQSMHSAEFTKLFSSFIMLKDNICNIDASDIAIFIEDVYALQLNNRKIFKNVMLLVSLTSKQYDVHMEYDNEGECYCEDTNSCTTEKYFSQISVEEIFQIPPQKPDSEQLLKTIVDPEIIAIRFVDTLIGKSYEGQKLSGKKAVFELKFKQKTLYVAKESEQSIHGVENEFLTSAYIVIPPQLEGTSLDKLFKQKLLIPKITIEDVFVKQLDCRSIFKNITVYIELRLIPTYEICYSQHENYTNWSLHMMHSNGNNDTIICQSEDQKLVNPQWSPTGRQIAYLKGSDNTFMLNILNVKSLNNTAITRTNNFHTVTEYSWFDEGRKILFSAVNEGCIDIYIYDIFSKSIERLTNGKNLVHNSMPLASYDNKLIAYQKSVSSIKNIWLMNNEGKNNIKLTDGYNVKNMQWIPNSYKIVFINSISGQNNNLYIVDVNSKKVDSLLEKISLTNINEIKISPNGKLIAILGEEFANKKLLIYNLKSKKLEFVIKSEQCNNISEFVWSTDSNIIYYVLKYYGYYNIYSYCLINNQSTQLTNIDSSYIELCYRPTIG